MNEQETKVVHFDVNARLSPDLIDQLCDMIKEKARQLPQVAVGWNCLVGEQEGPTKDNPHYHFSISMNDDQFDDLKHDALNRQWLIIAFGNESVITKDEAIDEAETT